MRDLPHQGHRSVVLPDIAGDLWVSHAGQYLHKTHSCDFKVSDTLAFSLVVKGRGYWQVDEGTEYEIHSGDSFSIHPNHHYRFGPWTGHPWQEIYIVLGGSQTQQWIQSGLATLEDSPQSMPQPKDLANRFAQIFSMENLHSRYRGDKLRNLIEALILERSMQLEGHSHHLTPLIEEARQYQMAHLYHKLDMESWARNNSVSYSWLRDRFRKELGVSPARYHMKLRCSHAQQLLDHGYSVTQVAHEMGFNDLYSFSRAFKSTTGVSPSAYRGI